MSDARTDVETLRLVDDGVFPNNDLPVLIYRGTIAPDPNDPAATIDERFQRNGWTGTWRNGIFDVHHYHATAHEALGCARGWVRVLLGGPHGEEVDMYAGDVALLPAGTAHRNLGHSDDYLIVGAYPLGQSPDMCYGTPADHDAAKRSIIKVPLPETDPVHGEDGPLPRQWGR
jgi:uncharacterized protein YjlB